MQPVIFFIDVILHTHRFRCFNVGMDVNVIVGNDLALRQTECMPELMAADRQLSQYFINQYTHHTLTT